MRLPTPFVKLPLAFDAGQLAAEALQFEESEWQKHPQGFAGNSALILISRGGTDNDDAFGPMASTSRLQHCPYLTQVLASFNTVIGRSRLMRLAPGAEVKPHSDIAYYWRDHTRIHVPIVTDPGVRFICDGVEVRMAAGEAWIFDNWRIHQVLNHTNVTRIHLVIDTVGSAAFWRLVSQGSLISAYAPAVNIAPEPRTIAYNAAQKAAPIIEQHNLDAAVHPDSVLAIVQEWLADLRQSSSAQACYGQLELQLVDFAHNWRSIWAAHNAATDRYCAYQELLQRTLHQADQTFADVRLFSNGMPFVQILHSYLQAFLTPQAEVASPPKIPRFDRPIIILAAPRSGSTLLYETLSRHPDIWALGNESHGEIESLPGLSPADRGYASNALGAADAGPHIAETIRQIFAERMRNSVGANFTLLPASSRPEHVRFLEKTPKNALRVPFLNAIFEDAFFIFLHRAPQPNLASMMEAWRSGKFITYRSLPGWRGPPWSLLLIPNWQKLPPDDLATVVAHQWCAANAAILDGLTQLPAERWRSLSYEEFTASPAEAVNRLCEFCKLSPASLMDQLEKRELPLSRHALTPPAPDKWLRHKSEIDRIIDLVKPVEIRIQELGNHL